MTRSGEAASIDVEEIFSAWLAGFGEALGARRVDDLAAMFTADGFWKDMLSFSWDYPTFQGRYEIAAALARSLDDFAPRYVRPAAGRAAPRLVRRSGRTLIEAYFDFDTRFGTGTGFARLIHDPDAPTAPRIFILLTTLQQLVGREERIGANRPTGNEYSQNLTSRNWLDDRVRDRAYADRDPQVLIVGAGHAGLALAARLRHMGVDVLVVEKSARIGDVWRTRYHSLTLHNQVFANHLPYLPFPQTWPTWLPKDKLANWLEIYAEALDLNVWTGTQLMDARYDAALSSWTARLHCADGTERTMRCAHLVAAMGVSGSVPNVPDLPGLDAFDGVVLHSSQFRSGGGYEGKRAIVVGAGNSGHDVAQDLHVNGAQVTMLQRGPSCVVSLEPTATKIYSIYSEGLSIEDVDLLTAAVPFPVLEDTYKRMTKQSQALDNALLADLKAVGFQTYHGSDETGFHMMYLRGEGGYYIDVGCSKLIGSGAIGVVSAQAVDRFVADGLRLTDGSVVPSDVVVLATGFKNMQENIARIVGDDVARRVGPVWGFDEHRMMRNMWTQTAQDGFWVMGGGLIDARLFSRFLAIQIAAALDGKLPRRQIAQSGERLAA